MEQLLKELTDRLKSQFGQRLVSLVLYGSAAAGDADTEFSDLNLLCVLDELNAATLGQAEPVLRWWRENRQPAPLLMTEHEVAASTDCFPIEFQDMKERRRILHGRDVVAALQIDFRHHRAQVEHELRSKLLLLRQRAAGILGNPEALMNFCADTLSTFCVLGRHALLLNGKRVEPRKRSVIAELANTLGQPFDAFETLAGIREGRSFPGGVADAARLFDNYLVQIEAIAGSVDGLEK